MHLWTVVACEKKYFSRFGALLYVHNLEWKSSFVAVKIFFNVGLHKH